MSIPRELRIEKNHIYQEPIREIKQQYSSEAIFENCKINGEIELSGVSGRQGDLKIQLHKEEFKRFTVKVAVGKGKYSFFTYDAVAQEVELSREYSGLTRDIIMSRRKKLRPDQRIEEIRIVIDTYSVEVFVNHGEMAFSMLIFTDEESDGIRFEADGEVCADIEYHKIACQGE